MTTPKKAKKKPNKQHDIRGASFVRLAERLRKQSHLFRLRHEPNDTNWGAVFALEIIASELEAEGKASRRLR